MKRVPVPLGPETYEVIVGTGVAERLPDTLTRRCPAARYAIIADSTVADLHGERIRSLAKAVAPADVFRFPAGEWNKTREQWQTVTDAMLAAGVGRDGAVVALGGGVTGDLAGFVAATYLRGIPYVQIPTTVLAMVDSSVGGKTGVDTALGKNLVGAFHQPRAVIADVELLGTLPDMHVRAGLAEAVKHGAIADRRHLIQIESTRAALFAKDADALVAVVQRSVTIKAEVVAGDPQERDRRAVLNFGHTIGHAFEAVSGFALLHGEAVGMGMLVEARMGELLGITERGTAAELGRVLAELQLPLERPEASPADLLEVIERDKKSRGGAVRFAFLKELGQAAREKDGGWTFEAPDNVILEALSPESEAIQS